MIRSIPDAPLRALSHHLSPLARRGRPVGRPYPAPSTRHPARLTLYFFVGLFLFPALALAQTTTPDPFAGAPLGSVRGFVENGTAAASVPDGLPVTLIISRDGDTLRQIEAAVQPDDSYTLADVPLLADADYVAVAEHRDVLFASAILRPTAGQTQFDLPITLYELTEDVSVLSISRLVTQVRLGTPTAEIRQTFTFRNSGDRAFITTEALPDGRALTLAINLPPGAQVVSFDRPNRYLVDSQRFVVLDTQPVLPGEVHSISLIYLLPYDGAGAVIDQPISYPLNGEARLLVNPPEAGLTSDLFIGQGQETLGERTFAVYGGPSLLNPGASLVYELRGGLTPMVTPGGAPLMLFALIGGAVALLIVLVVMRITLRQRQAPSRAGLIRALESQIATIDRRHAAGELNHDLWHRQRALLQTRLDQLRQPGPPSEDE